MARYIDGDLIKNIDTVSYKRKSSNLGAIIANFAIIGAKQVIDNIPTADVAPVVHSRWIAVNNPNFSPFDNSCEFIYLCNNCGNGNGMSKNSNYCPVCGAKMDEEVNDG